MNKINILDLPLEVIVHILTYLQKDNLLDARLVCTRFYMASLAPQFLGSEKVVFNKKWNSLHPSDLLKSVRNFHHLRFESERPLCYVPEVWCKLGPNLKSLSLSLCRLTEHDFFAILRHCLSLKSLEISSCFVKPSSQSEAQSYNHDDGVTFESTESPELKNLESFRVENRFDPRLFWQILARAPNLKSLAVHGLQVVRVGSSKRCLPLMLEDVYEFLKARGHQLAGLELTLVHWLTRDPFVNDRLSADLSKIIQLEKFLTNLNVGGYFIKNQLKCQQLTLGNVSSSTLGCICQDLHHLKCLDISSSSLSTADAKKLSTLKNLTSLSLSLDFPFGAKERAEIYRALCCGVNTKLKRLKLVGSPSFGHGSRTSANLLFELVKNYPALTHLHLCNWESSLNDVSVQCIFQHLVSLESLTMRGAQITDEGLKGSVEVKKRSRVPCDVYDDHVPLGFSIARLQRLQELDLDRCANVRGRVFTEGIKIPELRKVCLSKCSEKFSCEGLVALFENNPTIEELELPDGFWFQHRVVDAILQNLKRLRRIVLGWNTLNLSTGDIERLKQHCRETLVCADEEDDERHEVYRYS